MAFPSSCACALGGPGAMAHGGQTEISLSKDLLCHPTALRTWSPDAPVTGSILQPHAGHGGSVFVASRVVG